MLVKHNYINFAYVNKALWTLLLSVPLIQLDLLLTFLSYNFTGQERHSLLLGILIIFFYIVGTLFSETLILR